MLGLDIRDDWGRLIAPPDGEATALRQGGDEGSFALPDIPQKTVTLFVAAGAGGRRWRGGVPARPARLQRPGAADGGGLERHEARRCRDRLYVRDPLVAEPLLPRFLAPGDETRLTVLLHNLDLPAGEQRRHRLGRWPAGDQWSSPNWPRPWHPARRRCHSSP